jgi:hypothetical protein
MNLAAFLIGLVGPVMARWLSAMGMSLISVAGMTAAYATLKAQVISNIGGLPAQAIALGGLFGIWEAVGIILGAFVFVMTWRGTSGFWRLAKT